MKIFLRILLGILLVVFGVGFYLKSIENPHSGFIIGIGVLIFAFVLLPSFLYHRYKNKNLKDYTLDKEKLNQIIDNLRDL